MSNTVSRKTHTIHIAMLILAVVVVYWPVYNFNFLYGWDDQWFVTNHYTENGLNLANIWDILTHFHYGQYAPVNELYYTVLHTFFGYNAAYFHMASACLHFCNVFLVYLLVSRIVPILLSSSAMSTKHVPFFTALVFAILPINVEPVAWVSASKVLIYGLFYLLALVSYLSYLNRQKNSSAYYLTLLFFTLSFGAKEQAVTLPCCLLLFDYIYKRDLKANQVWLEKLPFFILALLYGVATIQSQGIDEGGRLFYPLYQRIPLAAYTLMEYLTKTVFPVNLSFLYPFPFENGQPTPWWLWLYPLALPVALYCFYDYVRQRWLLFGLLFFVIHIALVINLTSLARHSVIADRYTYVATIGICFIAAILFERARNGIKKYGRYVNAFGIIYIGALLIYSFSHVWVWRSAYTLKERMKTTIEQRADFDELKK